jgi:iron complex transport system permease protein
MLRKSKWFFPLLLALLTAVGLTAVAAGAVHISPADMYQGLRHFLLHEPVEGIYQNVFLQLRLPRVLLCGMAGAILAAGGVLMQGIFRNPIVEPGLVGTSSGAALGASIVFVMGAAISPALKSWAGPFLLPMAAFVGALLATGAVYALSSRAGRVSAVSLLLVGTAVNAVCLSGTGLMSYLARDPQARSITFWNLGNFSGAAWIQVAIAAVVLAVFILLTRRYAKDLNALLLGEEEAGYLGVDAAKLKRKILVVTALSVAVVTAFAGVIAFVGLIVPHILRLLGGSDNRRLLPASMIAGATVLLLADLLARVLIAPAELPVGIITSIVGGPVFILLLRKSYSLPQGDQ